MQSLSNVCTHGEVNEGWSHSSLIDRIKVQLAYQYSLPYTSSRNYLNKELNKLSPPSEL